MKRTADGHVVGALTVAGSDSGGGAGIQADLKTFAAYGVYGMSAITAVTAQNTLGVQGVQYLDDSIVLQQMESVLTDIGTDAVKIGMLGSTSIVRTVAERLQQESQLPIVLDPVMVAKGGERLIDQDAIKAVREALFPVADVITPNIPEAEVLSERSINSWQDCFDAAQILHRQGAQAVIIKGGHASSGWSRKGVPELLPDSTLALDLLYDGTGFTYFATPHIESSKTHGTGCTYSSAIASGLALGNTLYEAVASAKEYIHEAIQRAADWDIGAGHGPTDHSVIPAVTEGIQAGKCYWLRNRVWYEAGRV